MYTKSGTPSNALGYGILDVIYAHGNDTLNVTKIIKHSCLIYARCEHMSVLRYKLVYYDIRTYRMARLLSTVPV